MVNPSSKTLAWVISAIKNLREIKGSSSKEILHYISSVYDLPPDNVKRQMHAALKRGVGYGILKKSDGNYSLPTDTEAECQEIASQELGLLDICCRLRKKRRRGRTRRRRSACKRRRRRSRRCRRRRRKRRCSVNSILKKLERKEKSRCRRRRRRRRRPVCRPMRRCYSPGGLSSTDKTAPGKGERTNNSNTDIKEASNWESWTNETCHCQEEEKKDPTG